MLQSLANKTTALARHLTAAQRALPDFIIIGAQKCGTTSLYAYLSQHPEVLPASRKEVHFFDLNWQRGLSWYRAQFPRRAELKGSPVRKQTGEASPLYLFDPHVPERVAACVPQARLIVLLRDPVARAYSHYQHERRKGRETRSFAQAIEQALHEEAQHGDVVDGDLDRRHSYLSRGLYADQLERWFHFFPRSQFLIMRAEDLFEQPASMYARTLAFLGLNDWQPERFAAHNTNSYPPLPAALNDELAAFFQTGSSRLAEMLGEEFTWPQPQVAQDVK